MSQIRLSRLGLCSLEGLRWIWGESGGPREEEGAVQAAALHCNLSGAGGLGSDQFQAVLSHSPTSISLAPEILSSLDIPGARGDAGDKETQVVL